MTSKVDRRVFCLWLGGHPMSDARRGQLARLREGVGVDVELVTEADLPRWTLSGRPLHPAWVGLTAMHQADYLRAYLVACHGGGYADIKTPSADWVSSFDLVDSGAVDCVGYPVPGPSNAARFGLPPDVTLGCAFRPALYRHLLYRRRHKRLLGGGAFIMRHGSAIASDYLAGVEAVLDRVGERLSVERVVGSDGTRLPGFEVYRGELAGYPLTWGAMCMDVLQPIGLRHGRRVALSLPEPVWMDTADYR